MKKVLIFIFIVLTFMLSGFIYFKSNFTAQIENNKTDKEKLTFWTIQLKPIYEKQINSIIEQFENTHPDYRIVWVDIPIQEAQKRTLASILSSSPPDIVNLNPDFSSILAQKNALYIFENKDCEQFHSNLVDKLKYNNKIYAIPFYFTSPVTIYNKEIYSKCTNQTDVTNFITSYDDLFKIAKDIKKCSNVPAFISSINENDVFAKILNKYDVSGALTENQINTAEYIYSNFNNMYRDNALPKDILSINHREAIERYMSGNAVITVTGSNFLKTIKQNAEDIYLNSAISKQLTGSNGAYDIALMNLIIPKKSKNIKPAIEFILLLTNKENQLELAKITNVLPANKYALEDDYFKNCSDDLIEQSRCLSVQQLENINQITFKDKNKNSINEHINKTLEEILLNKTDKNSIKIKIEKLFKDIQSLQK